MSIVLSIFTNPFVLSGLFAWGVFIVLSISAKKVIVYITIPVSIITLFVILVLSITISDFNTDNEPRVVGMLLATLLWALLSIILLANHSPAWLRRVLDSG
jgi:hypothetical protein